MEEGNRGDSGPLRWEGTSKQRGRKGNSGNSLGRILFTFFFGTISINAIVSTNCMPKTCQTVSIRAEDSCPHQCKISKKCAVCRVAFGFSGQPSLAK